jgi:hypothetical protein
MFNLSYQACIPAGWWFVCPSLQPRRVAAMSVAKRVSEEMGVDLGQEVRLEQQEQPGMGTKLQQQGWMAQRALSACTWFHD